MDDRLTPGTTANCKCASSKSAKWFKSVAERTVAFTLCRKTKDAVDKKNLRVPVILAVGSSGVLVNSPPKDKANFAFFFFFSSFYL